jgi:hypothetical protein
MESYLSRLNYNYNDRYYISLSARTDASSRFGPDYRWGKFWSVGASWRISQEKFMSGISWLSDLKLKASYGTQGNDNLGEYYKYQGLYQLNWNNMEFPGMIAYRLATPTLVWEKNISLNGGVEFTVFDRLTVGFEVYRRKSDDLLFPVPLPASTGYPSIDSNAGAMQNTGFDFDASLLIIDKDKFKWDADINLSHYKNEITRMPEGQDQILNGTKKWMVGHSVYDYYMKKFAGVDQETGKSLWYIDDGAGGTTTTDFFSDATRYYTGTSSIPDLQGALTNSFKLGDFDLSLLLTFSIGGEILDGSYQSLMGNTAGDAMHKDQLKRWTSTNTKTNVPILDMDINANETSDRFLTSANYLNFRNLTFGYSLPRKLSNSLNISSARVSLMVTNIHLFSARKGLDPQQSYNGITSDSYSPLRTTSVSLSMNF